MRKHAWIRQVKFSISIYIFARNPATFSWYENLWGYINTHRPSEYFLYLRKFHLMILCKLYFVVKVSRAPLQHAVIPNLKLTHLRWSYMLNKERCDYLPVSVEGLFLPRLKGNPHIHYIQTETYSLIYCESALFIEKSAYHPDMIILDLTVSINLHFRDWLCLWHFWGNLKGFAFFSLAILKWLDWSRSKTAGKLCRMKKVLYAASLGLALMSSISFFSSILNNPSWASSSQIIVIIHVVNLING